MSYARFGENSDVYVYSHVGGFIECCGCILGDKWDFHSVAEIVTHLHEHVEAGHKVHPELLDPAMYEDERFVAMCGTFMCREETGHDGPHTPVKDARHEAIRARSEGF